MPHAGLRAGLLAGLLLAVHSGCGTLPTPDFTRVMPEVTAPPAAEPETAELPPERVAELCLAAARELEKNGLEREAAAQYERARELDPRHRQVARRLAVLYDRQGEFTRALAEYQLALEQQPRDAELLNDLGYCHYQRGDWAEAEKHLRQALELDAKCRRAWGNLGLVLAWQGRYDDSLAAFAKVIPPAQARANVGIILTQQGHAERARLYLQEALQQDPDLRAARAVLTWLDQAPLPTDKSSPAH